MLHIDDKLVCVYSINILLNCSLNYFYPLFIGEIKLNENINISNEYEENTKI